MPSSFDYAPIRVVPRVERGEAVNAGVVLFCRPLRFLAAKTELDEGLLRALAPDCEFQAVETLLTTMERIAAGDPGGGPIAALPVSATPARVGGTRLEDPPTVVTDTEVHAPRQGAPVLLTLVCLLVLAATFAGSYAVTTLLR